MMEEKNVRKPDELTEMQMEKIAGGNLAEEYRSRWFCLVCDKYVPYTEEVAKDDCCPVCKNKLVIK